jgi:hypothetical protein
MHKETLAVVVVTAVLVVTAVVVAERDDSQYVPVKPVGQTQRIAPLTK